MLLNPSYLLELLNTNNIKINKCIHIGAHKCEELPIYITMGLAKDDIIWIEGNDDMVAVAKNNNIAVHNYIITDKDDVEVILYKANDTASSSILDMKRHVEVYPDISYANSIKSKSITIDTFLDITGIKSDEYNFLNIAIQGAELMALRGAINYLKYAKAIYIKIHEIELYKNCPSIKEIDDFLRCYNFTRIITIMTEKGWGDALYIISS
jgi:FkbM family methyltransferase